MVYVGIRFIVPDLNHRLDKYIRTNSWNYNCALNLEEIIDSLLLLIPRNLQTFKYEQNHIE